MKVYASFKILTMCLTAYDNPKLSQKTNQQKVIDLISCLYWVAINPFW